MHKRLVAGVCGLAAAAGILAGCGQQAQEPMRFEWSEPTTVVTVSTEPAARFAFGDIAWRWYESDDGEIRTSRHAVVSQEGDWLVVTTCINDDPAVVREVLPEYLGFPETETDLLPVSECYATEIEALAAAEALREG